MRDKLLFLIFVFWLLLPVSIFAQEKKVYAVGGSFVSLSNINNGNDRRFGHSNPDGAEIYFHRFREGKEYWEKLYNYPHTGWSVSWIDHRNRFIGHTFSVSRYLDYIFLRRKSFELYFKASQGVMYATRVYKLGSNKDELYNNAVSQRLNFSEQLGFGIYFYPVKHLTFKLATTVTHFSNGAFSQPNDGLNMWAVHFGIAYMTRERSPSFYKNPDKPEDNKRVRVNINLAGGAKQMSDDDRKRYLLGTFSLYADKKVARVSALNLGVDLFVNTGVRHEIRNDTAYAGTDYKRVGICVGHELFINKVGVLTQMGYHVYSPYPDKSRFYQKAGLKYYITDKLYAAFTLRAFEFGYSNEVSWGVGVRL